MKLAFGIQSRQETSRPRRISRIVIGSLIAACIFGAAAPRHASAAATNVATPLQLSFTKLHANQTTSEVGSDEPYVVMFSADLSQTGTVALTDRTGIFSKTGKGDTVWETVPMWPPSGGKVKIADTDNVLVLAALMENDGSNASVVTNNVDSRLRSTLAANRSLSHSSLVSKLRTEMDSALDQARTSSGSNHDERIGSTQSVNVTPGNVLDAGNGTKVSISLRFTGYQANYDAYFTLSK